MKKFIVGVRIAIIITLISFYVYLSQPLGFTYSILGIDIGIRMKYQPLTTCLSYDITFAGEVAQNSKCGISPIRIFQAKQNMDDYLNFVESELQQNLF